MARLFIVSIVLHWSLNIVLDLLKEHELFIDHSASLENENLRSLGLSTALVAPSADLEKRFRHLKET